MEAEAKPIFVAPGLGFTPGTIKIVTKPHVPAEQEGPAVEHPSTVETVIMAHAKGLSEEQVKELSKAR